MLNLFFKNGHPNLLGSNPLSEIRTTPLGGRNMSFLAVIMEKQSLLVK